MVNRVPWLFEGFTLLLFIHQEHMTFDVIIENVITNKISFLTVEDCADLSDLIDHIHANHSNVTIEKITEVSA